MTIYKDDYGDELRLDITKSLDGATSIEMLITKPSGTVLTKTATRYGVTNEITYTTIAGDMDEAGIYKLNARVQWGATSKVTGDTSYKEVIELGDVSESQIIDALPAYTAIEAVQSSDEYNEDENEDADILYPQFAVYVRKAKGDLAKVLTTAGGITLSDDEELAALCYLIFDIFLQKNPGWSAASLSVAPGESISRVDPLKTDPRKSLSDLIERAFAASVATAGGILAPADDGEVLVHDDEVSYEAVKDATYDPEEEQA